MNETYMKTNNDSRNINKLSRFVVVTWNPMYALFTIKTDIQLNDTRKIAYIKNWKVQSPSLPQQNSLSCQLNI